MQRLHRPLGHAIENGDISLHKNNVRTFTQQTSIFACQTQLIKSFIHPRYNWKRCNKIKRLNTFQGQCRFFQSFIKSFFYYPGLLSLKKAALFFSFPPNNCKIQQLKFLQVKGRTHMKMTNEEAKRGNLARVCRYNGIIKQPI